MSLPAAIRTQFETKPFLQRIHASLQVMKPLAKAASITAMTISSLFGAAISWLSIEGSVRSIIDVIEDPRPIIRLRYLGDFAGWTSIALFSVVAVKGIFERIMAEGEYIKAQNICREGVTECSYDEVVNLVDDLEARCLFSKTVASRRLVTTRIFHDQEPEYNLLLDRRLAGIYEEVHSDINTAFSMKNHIHRFCSSQRLIKNKGCCLLTSSRIFGIVFPAILVLNFMLSITGEVGLAAEVFGNRSDLTSIGHLGEWPVNTIEAIATAYLFHKWYTVAPGNHEVVKEIYQRHAEHVEPELLDRFNETARQELEGVSQDSAYLRLQTDNELEIV